MDNTKRFKTVVANENVPVVPAHVRPTGGLRPLWSKKENRDRAFVEAGGTKAGLRKTSIKSQLINPKYVEDSGVKGPTAFGDDKEFFGTLYSFEAR